MNVKDKVIPIDSKFSLENYNRILEEKDPIKHEQLEKQFKQDLKNRIDETSKYIRPTENTTDFAFISWPNPVTTPQQRLSFTISERTISW